MMQKVAAMIAAVLALHDTRWQPVLKSLQQMRRHFPHGHDIGDPGFFRLLIPNSECIETPARASRQLCPASCRHATTRSTRHFSEHCRLVCAAQAGDDDARAGALALQPADRLPRLRHGFVGPPRSC